MVVDVGTGSIHLHEGIPPCPVDHCIDVANDSVDVFLVWSTSTIYLVSHKMGPVHNSRNWNHKTLTHSSCIKKPELVADESIGK